MRRRRSRIAGRLLLCLDYDGTLAPIAAHPSEARLPASTARALRALARRRDIRLVIISGRALRDLRVRVGIPGLVYVGNHGLEAQGPRLRFRHPRAGRHRALFVRLAQQLSKALQSIPRAWVENKGLTLSVHWRQTPPAARAALHRLMPRVLASAVRRGAVRLTSGACSWEVRPPVAWDKGAAVAWLVSRQPHACSLIVYVGDDQTDEDAFRMTNRLGGLSILVSERPRTTAARKRLHDPKAVCRFLEEIRRLR